MLAIRIENQTLHQPSITSTYCHCFLPYKHKTPCNTKDLETPYEYEVKTPPPTDHPNTPSQNHDYLNSTPEEQICEIKAELVAEKTPSRKRSFNRG